LGRDDENSPWGERGVEGFGIVVCQIGILCGGSDEFLGMLISVPTTTTKNSANNRHSNRGRIEQGDTVVVDMSRGFDIHRYEIPTMCKMNNREQFSQKTPNTYV